MENETETKSKAERRQQKKKKRKYKIHGSSLRVIYRDAVMKRLREKK